MTTNTDNHKYFLILAIVGALLCLAAMVASVCLGFACEFDLIRSDSSWGVDDERRFGLSLCRSSCLTYLRRLGFAFKRPKKRLLKADEEKREAFVAAYAALREEAVGSGAKIFFADEAHFRADAELRGRWVLRGEPALVNSSSPRYGEKASYYSAVCLETGEVEWMDLEGNSNSGTSAAFLDQLRQRHPSVLLLGSSSVC